MDNIFIIIFSRTFLAFCFTGLFTSPLLMAHPVSCPDLISLVPTGSYLNQLCGDELGCLRKRLFYDHDSDELHIYHQSCNLHSDFCRARLLVKDSCALWRMGLSMVMTKRRAVFENAASLDELALQDLSQQHEITDNLSSDYNQTKYKEVLSWLKIKENDFHESCTNILYYPTSDLVTAKCSGKKIKREHFAVLTHASLYIGKEVRLRNFDGSIRAEMCQENECLPFDNHSDIINACHADNLTTTVVGNHLVCTKKDYTPPTVSYCELIEYAYNPKSELLLITCNGSNDIFHLHKPNECVSRNHELAVMSYKVDDYWPPIFTVVNYVNPLSWIFWVEESISSKQRNAPDKNLMCILPGKLSCSRDLL